jgi:cobalamin biosynthetic protein CobC
VADAPSLSLFAPPAERRLPAHGGDTAWAESRFGKPAEGWLDLSTGINPEPYPVPAVPDAFWHRLPTSADLGGLATAAADAYRTSVESVVVSPGSEAALNLLPKLLAPTKVAILAPGYGSHASAWKAAGHRIQGMSADNILANNTGEARILVVGNPNNPDGVRFPPEALLAIADRLQEQGGLLVVDEAFADGDPATSVSSHAGREGLVVFRSLGKFYGLAGLRLGFALAAPRLATALREGLGAWPVSGPASLIGAKALADTAWRESARKTLEVRGAALDAVLKKADLNVIGGTLLVRLIRSTSARTQFNRLAEKGVLVRAFIERSEWLRIGIPDEAGLARFGTALDALQAGP